METAPHSTPASRVSTAASGARARRFPSWTAALRYAEAQAARGRIARLWIDDRTDDGAEPAPMEVALVERAGQRIRVRPSTRDDDLDRKATLPWPNPDTEPGPMRTFEGGQAPRRPMLDEVVEVEDD